jgi:ankyrin repeat protein
MKAGRGIHEATRRGDVNKVIQLLNDGTDINSKDRFGQTPLMHAAHLGHFDLVQLLIKRGADLNTTAKYNLSALMLAIINGHEQTAGALIAAGADLTIQGGRGAAGFYGKTALDLAEERQQVQLVALLQRSGASRRSDR